MAAPAPPSWEEVYREHAGTVARWAARLGGPLLDPEDVTQEVFLLLHRLLPTFRGEAKLTTWLYRITENVVRQRRRREKLRRIFVSDQDHDRMEATGATGPEALERREAARLVYGALDRLPERQRNALALFELEGLTAEEIGELTGQKPNAVWVTLHRARKSFLAALQSGKVRSER